jgi:hypothetical protein
MSAAYEPVPTDENINTRDFRPARVRLNTSPIYKVFAISLALCLISFVSFKAGQWSVETSSGSLAAEQPLPAPTEDKEFESVEKPPLNDTAMPGNGKYSVG